MLMNPLYERLRLGSRVLSKLSDKYRKYFYSRLHMADILLAMIKARPCHDGIALNFSLENTKILNSIQLPSKYVVINIGGRDKIRHLKVELIIDVAKRLTIPLILLGDYTGCNLDFSKVSANIFNLIGKTNLSDLYFLIENAELVIAPDSMIMHMAAATDTSLIAIMGNALAETYGPYNCKSRVKILTRAPHCSPCSRIVCTKFSGNSCVQDISSDEIIESVRDLAPELLQYYD